MFLWAQKYKINSIYIYLKKQILGCDSDGNSEKWESVWVASVMSV